MFDLRLVEIRSDQFPRVGFGEREDGALDHGLSQRAVHGGEGGAVGVLRVRVIVGGDELGGGGVDGAAEGFEVAGGEEGVVFGVG